MNLQKMFNDGKGKLQIKTCFKEQNKGNKLPHTHFYIKQISPYLYHLIKSTYVYIKTYKKRANARFSIS